MLALSTSNRLLYKKNYDNIQILQKGVIINRLIISNTMAKKMTLKEANKKIARKGGKKTLERYGREHFVKLAKLSWEKRRKKNNNK